MVLCAAALVLFLYVDLMLAPPVLRHLQQSSHVNPEGGRSRSSLHRPVRSACNFLRLQISVESLGKVLRGLIDICATQVCPDLKRFTQVLCLMEADEQGLITRLRSFLNVVLCSRSTTSKTYTWCQLAPAEDIKQRTLTRFLYALSAVVLHQQVQGALQPQAI